jgi:hypothetical protein
MKACLAQREATPDHSDFYGLAGEVVATARSLQAMCRLLSRQVTGYGQGRVLRDDAGADPVRRLEIAAEHLDELGGLLARAERVADQYWSQIGHIGVEEDL